MAALMPSWASEITSLTPRRPRRASLRKTAILRGTTLPSKALMLRFCVHRGSQR